MQLFRGGKKGPGGKGAAFSQREMVQMGPLQVDYVHPSHAQIAWQFFINIAGSADIVRYSTCYPR